MSTIAAKTDTPHPTLPGTIHSAAAEVVKAGGQALPLVVDVRDEESVKSAIAQTVSTFGGLDIVVNNASAVQVTPVTATEMRRFDLMHQVNARGTFMVSKYAIPHLEKASNPHILMNSPPLDLQEKWFAPHTAYTMAKYGMSLVVLGLAGELRPKGIAVNALWPRATIATSAIRNLLGGDRVMADVALAGDHGGRGLSDLPQAGQNFYRPFPDRRHFPRIGRRDRFRTLPDRSVATAGGRVSSRPMNRLPRRALSSMGKETSASYRPPAESVKSPDGFQETLQTCRLCW